MTLVVCSWICSMPGCMFFCGLKTIYNAISITFKVWQAWCFLFNCIYSSTHSSSLTVTIKMWYWFKITVLGSVLIRKDLNNVYTIGDVYVIQLIIAIDTVSMQQFWLEHVSIQDYTPCGYFINDTYWCVWGFHSQIPITNAHISRTFFLSVERLANVGNTSLT